MAIATEQAHEQNNAAVKGDGGAAGLTENPEALQRWMELLRNLQHLVMPEKALTHDTMNKTNTHREGLNVLISRIDDMVILSARTAVISWCSTPEM